MDRKLYIILPILLIIAIIIGFIVLFWPQNGENKDTVSNPSEQQSKSPQEITRTSRSIFSFHISIPNGWQVQEYTLPDGRGFLVRQNPSSTIPSLSIGEYPASSNSELTNMMQGVSLSGYTKSERFFKGKTVTTYEGVSPIPEKVNGVSIPFYENVFLYPEGENIYLVSLKYDEGKQEQIEKLFDDHFFLLNL